MLKVIQESRSQEFRQSGRDQHRDEAGRKRFSCRCLLFLYSVARYHLQEYVQIIANLRYPIKNVSWWIYMYMYIYIWGICVYIYIYIQIYSKRLKDQQLPIQSVELSSSAIPGWGRDCHLMSLVIIPKPRILQSIAHMCVYIYIYLYIVKRLNILIYDCFQMSIYL